jgi:hypothetical protein
MSSGTAAETSFSAYARHREATYGKSCTKQAIARAVKTGRLLVAIERDGAGVPRIPDFALADREWDRRTDYRRHPGRLDVAPVVVDSCEVRAFEDVIEVHYTDPAADEDGDGSCAIGLELGEACRLAAALTDTVGRIRRR